MEKNWNELRNKILEHFKLENNEKLFLLSRIANRDDRIENADELKDYFDEMLIDNNLNTFQILVQKKKKKMCLIFEYDGHRVSWIPFNSPTSIDSSKYDWRSAFEKMKQFVKRQFGIGNKRNKINNEQDLKHIWEEMLLNPNSLSVFQIVVEKGGNESARLNDSICLLLKSFTSFSSKNDWGDIVKNLEPVENAIATIVQFSKDWYDDNKEYEKTLCLCRQTQIQILGAKYFGRQVIDQTNLSNALFRAMSLAENGWLNDKSTILGILDCMFKGTNLALNKRLHFIRHMLRMVKQIDKLDTVDKQQVYRSAITELFRNVQDLMSGARNEIDQIRLQILEELIQNQWEDEIPALDSNEAVLFNRALERMHISTSDIKYNGSNKVIHDISELKAKLFKCINSILSVTNTLTISEMENSIDLHMIMQQASQLLTYFDQTNKYYQHSLHIWFLKQFYVTKGMGWTQIFFTSEMIRTNYPIFVQPQMSDVFSVLKYQPPNLPSTDPFIGIYGDKYTNFRDTLLKGIQSGKVDPQYSGNKSDFIPLLAAALSLSNLCGSIFNPNFKS
ncbi:hypothetical protein RFI_35648 [Reticulomyxa filosa]|uniref:Uncharacterized protein n=1 Tax=Reticulomyxa filosa TaxID=46433 RepID=X6LKA0_RETFI|nr:hypothetical protein RFI_35648 [Reticulomyxa filosa]|eukprot:ETO01791.1 hypothetical protein RFI_35648 [Reticulomyxa filosa]